MSAVNFIGLTTNPRPPASPSRACWQLAIPLPELGLSLHIHTESRRPVTAHDRLLAANFASEMLEAHDGAMLDGVSVWRAIDDINVHLFDPSPRRLARDVRRSALTGRDDDGRNSAGAHMPRAAEPAARIGV